MIALKLENCVTLRSHLKISVFYFPCVLNEGYNNTTQLTECGDNNQKTDFKPFEGTKIISQKWSEIGKIILIFI